MGLIHSSVFNTAIITTTAAFFNVFNDFNVVFVVIVFIVAIS